MSVSEPGKIITPWAESGLKNPIPPAANPATGRAGFDQGFSAINMTAKEAGGIPPFGQDFNGIFYEVTNILRYMQAGGQPTFSSALATAIGGYPKGAMVLGSDGLTLWQSQIESNSVDPDIDPSNWGTFDIGLKAQLAAPGGAGLVGNGGIIFDSVADMTAATWLNVGQKVRTLGYYTSGDGGGNDYEVVAVGTGTADGGSIIDLFGSGLQAKGLFISNHNPLQFGAMADGLADNSSELERYVAWLPSDVLISGDETNILRAESAIAHIPKGKWVVTRVLDVLNKDIMWVVDHSAEISGWDLLNGRVERPGRRVNAKAFGTTDYATGFSVRQDPVNINDGGEVSGISDASALSTGTGRSSVAMYVDNRARPLLAEVGTAYYGADYATLGTPLSSDKLKLLRVGMVIETNHAQKWAGFIESWSSDGLTIWVSGWYENGSVIPGVPTSGVGLGVNPVNKVWAHNANVTLTEVSHANQAAGFELGLFNSKSQPAGQGQYPLVWGYDCVNLGAYKCDKAFLARGSFFVGFSAEGADTGYSYSGQGAPFSATKSGISTFSISQSGSIDMGYQGASGVRFIDFHSSGNANDYDARLQVSGGGSSAGLGTFTFQSQLASFESDVRPSSDNVRALGSSSQRWSQIYAATGTINTSDAREKTEPRIIDDKVLDAWGDVSLVCFQWLQSIEEKGYSARWHFGVVAQQVRDAFSARGLDGTRYGLLCYDEWGDEFEPIIDVRKNPETDELEEYETGELRQTQIAGNRWGIRSDQCLFLEAAYQRRRCERIEARLTALES